MTFCVSSSTDSHEFARQPGVLIRRMCDNLVKASFAALCDILSAFQSHIRSKKPLSVNITFGTQCSLVKFVRLLYYNKHVVTRIDCNCKLLSDSAVFPANTTNTV